MKNLENNLKKDKFKSILFLILIFSFNLKIITNRSELENKKNLVPS